MNMMIGSWFTNGRSTKRSTANASPTITIMVMMMANQVGTSTPVLIAIPVLIFLTLFNPDSTWTAVKD